MPQRPVTIRTLASVLRLSRTTVSDALNGQGRVNAGTAKRVLAAAEQMGYRPNALTGAVMSALRRARADSFHGTLAVVDVWEPERQPHGPFHVEIVSGMRSRAAELGFVVEQFEIGGKAMPLPRLNTVLVSRGVRGVAVLPSWIPPDLSGIDWTRFAGVYTDYLIESPALNSICADHYRGMITTLAALKARGYRRPGYLVPAGRDDRIEHRQVAAFCAFQMRHLGGGGVPPLITPDNPRFEEEFRPWFERHNPDVVLSHDQDVLDWMETCGARLPETHGFVLLNRIYRRRPCACLDLQGRLIGERAAEILIGQILRNELGFPECPTRTAIQPRWEEGPTIRPA